MLIYAFLCVKNYDQSSTGGRGGRMISGTLDTTGVQLMAANPNKNNNKHIFI